MNDLQVEIKAECGVAPVHNLDKIKIQLEELLKDFENKPIKDIKEAKATRAIINKMFDALENERKRVKDIINKPYEEFKKVYDDAIARLVECQDYIKAKCTELEDKAKCTELPKNTIAFICECDLKEQEKIEKFLIKNGINYKTKIKE